MNSTKLLDWDNKYSVFSNNLDNQHKILFSIINKLILSGNKSKEKDFAYTVLSELIDYSSEHFQTEEKLFDEFNYIYTLEHIADHTFFLKKISGFYNLLQKRSEQQITLKLLDFLRQWLDDHILTHDKKYIECLEENGYLKTHKKQDE